MVHKNSKIEVSFADEGAFVADIKGNGVGNIATSKRISVVSHFVSFDGGIRIR